MKKKKDKIDQLLAAYEQAAAKRIAKKKKIEDRVKAKERERALFEENIRKKITGVFRPVMQQLVARLDKKLFSTSVDKLGFMNAILEQYKIQSLKEKEVYFWVALSATEETNNARLSYAYSIDEESDEEYDAQCLNSAELDEQLIKNKFILCLQKISK